MGIQKWLSVSIAVVSERSAIKRSPDGFTGSDYPTIAQSDGGRYRRPAQASPRQRPNNSEETGLAAFSPSISVAPCGTRRAPVRFARLRPALPWRFSFRG